MDSGTNIKKFSEKEKKAKKKAKQEKEDEKRNNILQESYKTWEAVMKGKQDISDVLNTTQVYVPSLKRSDRYHTISVSDFLKERNITIGDIIEDPVGTINTSKLARKISMMDTPYETLYISSYLKEKGIPKGYKSYKEFMKYLKPESDVFKICLTSLGKYISNHEEVVDFFELLHDSFRFTLMTSEEEKKIIFKKCNEIIQSLRHDMKKYFMIYIATSHHYFAKFLVAEYVK